MLHNDVYIQEVIYRDQTGEVSKSSFVGQYKQATCVMAPNTPVADARVDRIEQLIRHLATETRRAHLEETSLRLEMSLDKKSRPDTLVTRLIMNEFSLYTKNTPLSIEEYKALITQVSHIAADLPPDIHLLIATLPVLWTDGNIRNAALYVQSPLSTDGKVLIHHFSKENKSHIDIRYAYTDQDVYKLRPDLLDETHSPDFVLRDTPVTLNDVDQFGGALRITTSQGFSFFTVTEICLDHHKKVGENNLLHLAFQLYYHGTPIPFHINQVITSNSINPSEDSLFTTYTHADPFIVDQGSIRAHFLLGPTMAFGSAASTLSVYKPKKLQMPYKESMLEALFDFSDFDPETFLSKATQTIETDDRSLPSGTTLPPEEGMNDEELADLNAIIAEQFEGELALSSDSRTLFTQVKCVSGDEADMASSLGNHVYDFLPPSENASPSQTMMNDDELADLNAIIAEQYKGELALSSDCHILFTQVKRVSADEAGMAGLLGSCVYDSLPPSENTSPPLTMMNDDELADLNAIIAEQFKGEVTLDSNCRTPLTQIENVNAIQTDVARFSALPDDGLKELNQPFGNTPQQNPDIDQSNRPLFLGQNHRLFKEQPKKSSSQRYLETTHAARKATIDSNRI